MEKFGLTWPGKDSARSKAFEPTGKNLFPIKNESVDWDTTQNLIIEGDNLDVLKLLQKSYYGKVKMIYIDPPYNTGTQFIYSDIFKSESASAIVTSVNSSSRMGDRHSSWLSMIYPRLILARNLLTPDGVIFVSIDDREIDNLLLICKEIFEEDCHIATLIWKSKSGGANDSKDIATDHEYVLCFSRNPGEANLGLDPDAIISKVHNKEDEHGEYYLERLDKQNLNYSKSLDYELVGPNGDIYKLKHRNRANPNAIWRMV